MKRLINIGLLVFAARQSSCDLRSERASRSRVYIHSLPVLVCFVYLHDKWTATKRSKIIVRPTLLISHLRIFMVTGQEKYGCWLDGRVVWCEQLFLLKLVIVPVSAKVLWKRKAVNICGIKRVYSVLSLPTVCYCVLKFYLAALHFLPNGCTTEGCSCNLMLLIGFANPRLRLTERRAVVSLSSK